MRCSGGRRHDWASNRGLRRPLSVTQALHQAGPVVALPSRIAANFPETSHKTYDGLWMHARKRDYRCDSGLICLSFLTVRVIHEPTV